VRVVKEGDIREALKARVESYGGEIRAVSWLGRRHAPDVLALFPPDSWYCRRFPLPEGEHVFIETKRPKKGATEAQAREHERMREAGCTVYVITSPDELNEWLMPR